LIGRGDEVVCIDNLSTSDGTNLAGLSGHAAFTFLRHNVTSEVRVPGVVDAVMHFASAASPRDYLEMPIQTLKVGSLGTHNLLGLAKTKGALFFLASTSEVYGDAAVHPQPESYRGNVDPIGPRGVYDEAKRFAEALTMAYHSAHGLDVRIARIFNTYGPRMRPADGRVVSNFIVSALAGKPLTVYGDGSQTRSFCYVDDTVRGLLALLDSADTGAGRDAGPGPGPGPVNIGNPAELTVNDLAALVLELTGSTAGVVHEPRPADDPERRQPDISLARATLGWEPQVDLRTGLARTIDWFRTII